MVEFLVVLFIISVIAALITPIYGAINKHLGAEEVRRGQKIVENIFNEMRAELGDFYLWPDVTKKAFYKEFEKHIDYRELKPGEYTYSEDVVKYGGNRYYLKNGMILTLSTYSYHDKKTTGKHMLIAFDTNGPEKPNRPGIDIFAMSFNKDPNNTTLHPYGIYPAGHNLPDGEDLAYGCRGLGEGLAYWYFFPNMHNHTCLEYLNRSNFKIDDRYPIKNFGKRF